MEEFKKDLLKLVRYSRKNEIVALVIVLLLAVVGVAYTVSPYDEFYGTDDGYATLDVVYILGPFAGYEDGEKEFYIAEDSEGYWSVIATDGSQGLPVYGEDITVDEIPYLEPITVYGKSKEIPSDAGIYMVEFLNLAGFDDITNYNYDEYIGNYYLDTTINKGEMIRVCIIVAIIAAVFGIATAVMNLLKKKSIIKSLESLEQTGELNQIYSDFANNPNRILNKPLSLAISSNYILDFSGDEGLRIVNLNGIVNVFKCRIVNGVETNNWHIALETADNRRYIIGDYPKETTAFEAVINQIRAIIAQKGYM